MEKVFDNVNTFAVKSLHLTYPLWLLCREWNESLEWKYIARQFTIHKRKIYSLIMLVWMEFFLKKCHMLYKLFYVILPFTRHWTNKYIRISSFFILSTKVVYRAGVD